jgi:putative hemolysin
MSLKDLSYARHEYPAVQRALFRLLELASGQARFLRHYGEQFDPWLDAMRERAPWGWNDGLDRLGIERRVYGETWPVEVPEDKPVVMVANHPFGVLDGVTMLALAEHLKRPFKVMIDKALLRFEPLRDFALPVDFTETPQAKQNNVESRREARACLNRGETIIVFPAAGVAIARNPFGPAVDQPWGPLTASLILDTRATTVPVYFPGRCSTMFHLFGRIKLDLRRTLMASEFFRRCGTPIDVHIGKPIAFEVLEAIGERPAIMQHLRQVVHSLGDMQQHSEIAA